jgi:hypothetical protein
MAPQRGDELFCRGCQGLRYRTTVNRFLVNPPRKVTVRMG